MSKEFIKPIFRAYSDSLLSFIRFLRNSLPLIPGESDFSSLEKFDEETRK